LEYNLLNFINRWPHSIQLKEENYEYILKKMPKLINLVLYENFIQSIMGDRLFATEALALDPQTYQIILMKM